MSDSLFVNGLTPTMLSNLLTVICIFDKWLFYKNSRTVLITDKKLSFTFVSLNYGTMKDF